MQRRLGALLLIAPVLLAVGCSDQLVTPSQEALFNHGGKNHDSSKGDDGSGYEIITLSGAAGRGLDITAPDAAGDVTIVGVYHSSAGFNQAAKWIVRKGGAIEGPIALGLVPDFEDAHQVAVGINKHGTIVGNVQNRSNRRGGFIYHEGEMRLLQRVVGDTYGYEATGINDAGIAAGWIDLAVRDAEGALVGRVTRGAVWLDPSDNEREALLLEPLEGHEHSWVTWSGSINNEGYVLGTSSSSDPEGRPRASVRWKVTDGAVSGPSEIVTDAEGFHPQGMNDSGHVAGFYEPWSREGALLRSGSSTVEGLPPLPDHEDSEARGISNMVEGVLQIVGGSGFFTSGANERPVVWTVDSEGVRDVVYLGRPKNHHSALAEAINDEGWIVGAAQSNRGQIATLWRPTGENGGGDDGGGDDGGGDKPCNPHPRTGVCR